MNIGEDTIKAIAKQGSTSDQIQRKLLRDYVSKIEIPKVISKSKDDSQMQP